MSEFFQSLPEAITYIFKKEGTPLLSLDCICQALSDPSLFVNSNSGPIPCSSFSKRRINSTLTCSENFVRAGHPSSCMWGLRPSNPLFLSDGALLSSITQVLSQNGPLLTAEIVEKGDITGATPKLISEFLFQHKTEFSILPSQQWWFAEQPIPEKWNFDNIISAICHAFNVIDKSATAEEIQWLLCLSTIDRTKKITRKKISNELSRRTDLFRHISWAKYSLIQQGTPQTSLFLTQTSSSVPISYSLELNCNNWSRMGCNGEQGEFKRDWLAPCQTPPPNTDYFDPQEFFSIGFSGSFVCP
ncbi:hypothetical protein GPJ56_006534 [Histomonas meleagridis]|uniref:uncharacterized protein n=1 Tax=Histomonas meleagridis TaxID=135588 RepID=UPI003559781C|nr:hypothetical protein GPJ56_006534 [Histomonas meleagridis]KAH0801771.1 hypothetical protein GO595_005452 [Histomonas meleagridis]